MEGGRNWVGDSRKRVEDRREEIEIQMKGKIDGIRWEMGD